MDTDHSDHRKANPAEESLKNQGDKLAKQVDAVVEEAAKDEADGKSDNQENRQTP